MVAGTLMNSRQIALWSLIVAAIGVPIGVAQLYSSGDSASSSSSINTTTNANEANIDCSNVGTQTGNVSIRCDRNVNISVPQSNKPFARFEGTIDKQGIEAFDDFVEAHSDKIVRLTLRVEEPDTPKLHRFLPTETDRNMSITYFESCDDPVTCSGEMGVEYYFNVRDGGSISPCNAGAWCVEGYYSIEPAEGMRQGIVSVGIMGISDSQARLSDPEAR